jgi:DNA-binding IclR family transcriptional regulator
MQDRQFVTSLERGLNILRAFSRVAGGLSNGQLAKQTKLAPSTISRLVHTLRNLGYITYDRATRTYVLTPQVLSLGYPVLSRASLLHHVRPVLVKIADETGETCGFAQRDGLYATFLDCIRGRNMLSVQMEIGARLPLATSASGLCLLKACGEAERRMIASQLRAALTRRRAPVASFEQRLIAAMASPVVIMRDTWHRGIGGLSVPVSNGSEVGAITIPVATSHVSERDMRGFLSSKLMELADRNRLIPKGLVEANVGAIGETHAPPRRRNSLGR